MADQEQMGQLALIVGDFHIPQRCSEIPQKYKEMISPNKVSTVLCTGNMGCREVHDWLKSLAPSVHITQGDYQDQAITDLSQEKVIQFGGVKIGLIHGHQIIPWGDEQALSNKAKQLGVKILISGHNHSLKCSDHNGIHLINPGSMTGAYSTLKLDAVPSFIIMQFRSTHIILYSYFLQDGELKFVDTKFDKP